MSLGDLLGLPSVGGVGGCDFGVCGGAVPDSGFIQAGAAVAGGIAAWETIKDLVTAGMLMYAAYANARRHVKVPTQEELKRNCTPGRRVVEPADRPKGGTSVEQEYICNGVSYTVHERFYPNGRLYDSHVRPGPPKGGR